MTKTPSSSHVPAAVRLFATSFVLFGASVCFGQTHRLYYAQLDSAAISMMEMRLDEAERLGNNFITRHPENPSGYLFRAITLGWRLFFKPEDSDTEQQRQDLKQAGKSCRAFAEKYHRQEETRQEHREQKLRKQRDRVVKHGKNLARIYRDAILKRLKGKKEG